MSKKLHFYLAFLIAMILILILTTPGMANVSEEPLCSIQLATTNNHGRINDQFILYGELYADWLDGKLVNMCTGTVIFGDSFKRGRIISTYGEWCKFYNAACQLGYFFISITDTSDLEIYDPVSESYFVPDYASLVIFEVGGRF